jgi:hypothetical protein
MTGCCRCCALAGCALPDGWLLPLLRSCCASWLAPACAGRLLRCWLLLAGTAGVRWLWARCDGPWCHATVWGLLSLPNPALTPRENSDLSSPLLTLISLSVSQQPPCKTSIRSSAPVPVQSSIYLLSFRRFTHHAVQVELISILRPYNHSDFSAAANSRIVWQKQVAVLFLFRRLIGFPDTHETQ